MKDSSESSQELLYKTCGTCSQYIEVQLNPEGRISHCRFYGGCAGNTAGIAKLVVGMMPHEVIERLNGIRCGTKATSCPDQLCRALEQLEQMG